MHESGSNLTWHATAFRVQLIYVGRCIRTECKLALHATGWALYVLLASSLSQINTDVDGNDNVYESKQFRIVLMQYST
jgi:hypothetical protein